MLGLDPISAEPISSTPITTAPIVLPFVLRFATRGFVTRTTDVPQSEFIEGRLSRGSEVGRHINTVDEGQFGPLLETRYGDIELTNADGVLDEFVNNFHADGRSVRLLIGKTGFDQHNRERVDPYATFQVQYRAIAGDWHFEHDLIRLRLQDLSHRLHDKLQFLRYGGGGGIQGTQDIAGRSRPAAFGRVFNAKAQIVDPAVLTYQIHAGSVQEIIAVYDKGIPLEFAGNFPTYSDLVAANLPDTTATYGTVISQGFLKTSVIPSGTITVDLRGDNQGGYVETHAGVMHKMLTNYAGFTAVDIDEESFDQLDAAQPSQMGVFFEAGDESTAEDAITKVAFSCGAFVGQDRSGLYRVQRLERPASNPSWAFTDRTIIAIERERTPYGIPWKAWGVGYRHNSTVQTDADLAAGVTHARRQFLEVERRYAYLTDLGISQAHRSSGGAPLRQAYFVNQTEAQAETQRLLAFYGVGRALYRVLVKGVLFRVSIGDTVNVRYRRWDLEGGKNFVVVGIDEDINHEATELRIFG